MGLLRRILDQVLGRADASPTVSPPGWSTGVPESTPTLAPADAAVAPSSDGTTAGASDALAVQLNVAAPAMGDSLFIAAPGAQGLPAVEAVVPPADTAVSEAERSESSARVFTAFVPAEDVSAPSAPSRAALLEKRNAKVAERRAARAAEVAHRRATDIVFLGRGVSSRLGDRTSDVDRLRAAGLPVMSTPADVARALGLSIPRVRWLAFHAEVATRIHYVQFQVPKKSGGSRTLSAPHQHLATAQRWILKSILARLSADPAAHGFLPQRSIVTNARPHAGRAVVINLDLEAFFPSIEFPRVRKLFERLGYSPAVATILALLCTECPRREVLYSGTRYFVATGPRGLPQGACTSPALSNRVARRLDRRLSGLAVKLGAIYTRYADDITFSGDTDIAQKIGYLLARVRHIASDEGFAVNESKTRVQRRNRAQMVTGLVVNDMPALPRAEVRRLRAILHRARSEGIAAQNRHNRPNFMAWLEGKIAFIAMVRPELGAKLKAELKGLQRSS
jgi:retron-type reverse transcriptase